MRKITYTNSSNGLSAEFSSDDPLMHLDLKNFNGSSVGAAAITYKPVEFDGQKTISTSLSARTISLPVEFTARENNSYSRKSAFAVRDKLLRVFAPLDEGWLVWTDGTESRRIKCRTAETPQFTEHLPFLFSATFSLIADYPYWESTKEHSIELSSGYHTVTVTNSCGLAVPVCIDVPSGGSQPAILLKNTGAGIGFEIAPEQDCTVDTRECTVTYADGTFASHLLTTNSEYFKLLPGENYISALDIGGSGGAVLRWRDLYLGVN